MNSVFRHLYGMLPFMVCILPIHVFFRLIVLNLRGLKINWRHETALCLFVIFAAGLASQTVIPDMTITENGIDFDMSGKHHTALIPFRFFCYTYRDVFEYHLIHSLLIDYLGNIVMLPISKLWLLLLIPLFIVITLLPVLPVPQLPALPLLQPVLPVPLRLRWCLFRMRRS